MTLRKLFFWLHLTAGLTAGIVILIMSVTGVLLTYEKAIILWADTRHYPVAPPAPDSVRLPLEQLIARVSQAEPDAQLTTMTVRADSTLPVAFAAGPRVIYADPYTGAVLGDGSPGVRRFFRSVTDWHRVLAMTGESRPIGKGITGAANLAFLFVVCSGIYLWWPRSWSRQQVRSTTLFNGKLRGKARDFNWHNVFGFWSAVPLFFVVLGATVISYPWASNLSYRLAGDPPPPPARPAAAAAAAPAERRERPPRPHVTGIDAMWARAERQSPDWRAIALRLETTAEAPVVFTIDEGTGGQPQKKSTLTFNRSNGDEPKWEPFADQSRGRRFRSWLRFVHTGEFYGLPGQTIAGLASFGGAVLMITGLLLALRRFAAWVARVRSSRRVRDYSPSTASSTSSA